jgi:hypothetical protein
MLIRLRCLAVVVASAAAAEVFASLGLSEGRGRVRVVSSRVYLSSAGACAPRFIKKEEGMAGQDQACRSRLAKEKKGRGTCTKVSRGL